MTANTDSPGTPPNAPPRTLGHYVLEGELGRGGMGVVYLARDRKLDRLVAIKTLPPELARDPEQLGRFEREAKLLASLNHPNIATIHGLEEAPDSSRYLILERVEGETLADRLRRGALPVDETTRVSEQVADALEAAHDRGVIHRDLKPRNIMITPGGRVKVLDFGLAKRTSSDGRAAAPGASLVTEPGIMMGTPGYMSPEQILAQPQDARTDIFAFGCILFEALSGMKAFESESVPGLVAMVLSGEPDWSKIPENAPAGFRHLIGRCLEKDPDQRPATIHEVARSLRALLQEHATGATSRMASLSGTLHNLPREVASFVGRERELEECERLLGQTRILTLTGAGGSGKTRLALRLVSGLLQKHAGGVWFVDFGPLSDAALVMQAVAQALGVKEEGGRSLEKSLVERLGRSPTLLVLDNCEHVLETSGRLVEAMLQGCGELKVVATSREALGLGGEQVYSVPTLPVPTAGKRFTSDALAGFASVQLFVERATQVQPNFKLNGNADAVADICRRLDGIPFAIELAAARAKVLAVEQIRAKLDDRFRLLTGGSKAALPRQQTLRATIQWSYDHLHPEEQQLMRALAVFAGGWTLEGATRICGVSDDEFEVLDLLTRLVDKSLVVVEHARGDESRYRFLETVRQYALERLLEAGESEAVRDRHIDFFCALVEEAEPHLRAQDQGDWIRRLNREHENLFAALVWREPPEGEPETAIRMGGAVWRYWLLAGHLGVGRRLLSELLNSTAAGGPEARAKIIYGSALLGFAQGDYAGAQKEIDECLLIYRAAGNQDRVAACLAMLANIANQRGDYEEARRRYEEALVIHREAGNRHGVAMQLNNLGAVAWRTRDVGEARKLFDQACSEMRALGDRNSLSITLGNLANIANDQDDLLAARAYVLEQLKILQEIESKRPVLAVLENGSDLAERLGDSVRAITMRGAADTLREDAGIPFSAAESKTEEGIVAKLREKAGAGFEEAWSAGRSIALEEALSQTRAWLESLDGAPPSA